MLDPALTTTFALAKLPEVSWANSKVVVGWSLSASKIHCAWPVLQISNQHKKYSQGQNDVSSRHMNGLNEPFDSGVFQSNSLSFPSPSRNYLNFFKKFVQIMADWRNNICPWLYEPQPMLHHWMFKNG
eukprot:TRINITY_DN66664_c9_g7_i1.p1 TRINITY_DN66664_c9_g7~~TRINITY_DN66664_c9_g7_i1.p1  ORF type:complete len:128 (-),score=5.05 TRINITY_DN66664_c9_g7_i1:715-1098(-)